jgi:hypothetical protein
MKKSLGVNIKATNQAVDFLNNFLSNDDFSMNCIQQMYEDPSGVTDYIRSQGFDFDGSDLMTAFQNQMDFDIRMWAGIYKFNEPQDYTTKKLRILAKEGKICLDDSELDIKSEGNKTFTFKTGENTIKLTFSEHTNDDGSVAPNTFQGKIEIPQKEPQSILIDIQGEQIVYKEDVSWGVLEILGLISAILTVIGAPLMIKGFIDCCKRETHSSAVIELTERFDGIRDSLVREVQNRLNQQADHRLQTDKDAVVTEIRDYIVNRAFQLAQDPNISGMQINDQVKAISQNSQKEIEEYIENRIKLRYSVNLTQDLEQMRLLGDMSTIFGVKDSIVQEVVGQLNRRVIDGLNGEEFVINCIRAGVLDGHDHFLRQHAQEVQQQQAQIADQQRQTSDEHDAVERAIEDINRELQQPNLTEERKHELDEQMSQQVKKQADLERQREDLEIKNREYAEDLDRTTEEERRNNEERGKQRDELNRRGGSVIFR